MPSGSGVYECKLCHLNFPDNDSLHLHKVRSDLHHTCAVCYIDFAVPEALDRHCKQSHAHQQHLPCVCCNEVFTTMGGLIGHYEGNNRKDTEKISGFKAKVQSRTAQQKTMTAARNYVGSRFGVVLVDEPMPALLDYSTSSTTLTAQVATADPTFEVSGWSASADWGVQEESKNSAVTPGVEEDLMSFDDIINSDWNVPATNSKPKDDEFPALASYKNPTPGPNFMDELPAPISAWSKPLPVVAQKPSRSSSNVKVDPLLKAMVTERNTLANSSNIKVDPLTKAMAKTALAEVPTMSPFDPANPHFDAANYFISLLKHFRCPHPGCKSKFKARDAFIQHLKSASHQREKLQCYGCLRYFDSATALAQHASSQGVRCKVRETDEYEKEVDRWTAGYATTAGRWEDNTIRYTVTGKAQTTRGVGDAHKAKLAQMDEEKQQYWSKNTPTW